jgi:hypothetical protein
MFLWTRLLSNEGMHPTPGGRAAGDPQVVSYISNFSKGAI